MLDKESVVGDAAEQFSSRPEGRCILFQLRAEDDWVVFGSTG